MVRGGLRQIASGSALGVIAALVWGQLFDPDGPTAFVDPQVLSSITAVLAAVTLAACV